ncbi:MAG: hypothetical protein ACMUIM_05090 [bacterium]
MKYLYVILTILLIISLSGEISKAYYGGYLFPGYYPYFAPLANEALYSSGQEKGSYSNEERNLNGTLPDTLPGLEFISLAPMMSPFLGFPFGASGYGLGGYGYGLGGYGYGLGGYGYGMPEYGYGLSGFGWPGTGYGFGAGAPVISGTLEVKKIYQICNASGCFWVQAEDESEAE